VRVAALYDIHGNVPALEAVLADVDRASSWACAIDRADRDFLAGFEPTVSLEIDGLGPVLFCHGSPRSDLENITRATPEARFAPMVEGVSEAVIVCGHTHQQFDRHLAGRRVINAGAVGMPYEGVAAAFWLLLGPDVELRRTDYDVTPLIEGLNDEERELIRESLIEPVEPEWVTQYFESGAS
jgi:hypothetical protein